MQDLKVSVIQSDLHWHQPEANLAMFEEKIWTSSRENDIIVLPEMFTTGFTMDAENQAEPMGTRTSRWMQLMAKQTGSAIFGSYVVKENGHYFNRLLAVTPDGSCSVYDKRHLFRMAGEHETYHQGNERLVVSWKGWKICPLICYDLRFPVWSRNKVNDGVLDFDLLIYVANWPAPRVSAWDILLKARAIENTCYCIGVNRTGTDGMGITYPGHSAVIDPMGAVLSFEGGKQAVLNVTLNKSSLDEYRRKFPVHLDADDFELGA